MLAPFTQTTDLEEFRATIGPRYFPQVPPHAAGFTAYLADDTKLWRYLSTDGRTVIGAIGDAEAALALALDLLAGELSTPPVVAVRCSLPQMPHERVAAALPGISTGNWEMRWSTAEPPVRPGEDRVVRLREDEYAQIDAILDAALPDAHTRPGGARAATWYGIRDGDKVLAVAADCSAHGVGQINSIAVRPDVQGQGIGGALTAALTRKLRAGNEVVQLGVAERNADARRLYVRLGYTEEHRMTSFTVTPVAGPVSG